MSPKSESKSTNVSESFARGAVGGPRAALRLEAAGAFAGAVALYAHSGAGIGMFLALFLVPDLSMLGYLLGPRFGATSYNVAHSYLGPFALAALGMALHGLLPFAAIWAAHVAFDRMLGYGLKYATAFGDTHLGRIGRQTGINPSSASLGVGVGGSAFGHRGTDGFDLVR
jgi:hypothetical protein